MNILNVDVRKKIWRQFKHLIYNLNIIQPNTILQVKNIQHITTDLEIKKCEVNSNI